MRYAYSDVGRQKEGSTVVVHLSGKAANVVLLDEVNFANYRAGRQFFFHAGGLTRRSEARFPIPADGRWFVVVDLGGYNGRVKAKFEVLPPERSQPEPELGDALGEPAGRH